MQNCLGSKLCLEMTSQREPIPAQSQSREPSYSMDDPPHQSPSPVSGLVDQQTTVSQYLNPTPAQSPSPVPWLVDQQSTLSQCFNPAPSQSPSPASWVVDHYDWISASFSFSESQHFVMGQYTNIIVYQYLSQALAQSPGTLLGFVDQYTCIPVSQPSPAKIASPFSWLIDLFHNIPKVKASHAQSRGPCYGLVDQIN